jgi:hypothetical protein
VADPRGKFGGDAANLAGLAGHVDERVELQPAQRGQAFGSIAVDPDEGGPALRLTGDAAGGAGHLVAGRESRADDGTAEEDVSTEYE